MDYLDGDRYIDLDDSVHHMKKHFLAPDGRRDTLDNLISDYVTELLNDKKGTMTVEYKGKKGILTFSIGNTSVLGNSFLVANPDYDFFMDVGPYGNVSMRSNNKVDVSKMAVELFGGGGHPNAAGGRMQGVREIFVYETLKRIVNDWLARSEAGY